MKYYFSLLLLSLTAQSAYSAGFSYDDIAKRYPDSALSQQQYSNATMQGECLVGLKDLNFKKKNDFDPVAEWTTFRSGALLEQLPPCQVLVIMEVAQKELRQRE
jgi:hypothetical protein